LRVCAGSVRQVPRRCRDVAASRRPLAPADQHVSTAARHCSGQWTATPCPGAPRCSSQSTRCRLQRRGTTHSTAPRCRYQMSSSTSWNDSLHCSASPLLDVVFHVVERLTPLLRVAATRCRLQRRGTTHSTAPRRRYQMSSSTSWNDSLHCSALPLPDVVFHVVERLTPLLRVAAAGDVVVRLPTHIVLQSQSLSQRRRETAPENICMFHTPILTTLRPYLSIN